MAGWVLFVVEDLQQVLTSLEVFSKLQVLVFVSLVCHIEDIEDRRYSCVKIFIFTTRATETTEDVCSVGSFYDKTTINRGTQIRWSNEVV